MTDQTTTSSDPLAEEARRLAESLKDFRTTYERPARDAKSVMRRIERERKS